MEEKDKIVTFLGSLPPSFATIVTVQETEIDYLTLQFDQALINEEQK